VDDSDADRDALREIVQSAGHPCAVFSNARDFLATYLDTMPGCLLLDLRMPVMDGLELQAELAARALHIPVIFVTAFGEIACAVQAMRAGAVDFLEKPCRGRALLKSVEAALAKDKAIRDAASNDAATRLRLEGLSAREMEVLRHIAEGEASKQIAAALGISCRTVDAHRLHILRKLDAHSTPEMLRAAAFASRMRIDTDPLGRTADQNR
jgi:FixJ family two-component response regulator